MNHDIQLPLVENNLLTFYECYTIVSINTLHEAVGVSTFSVEADSETLISINHICKADIEGIPLVLFMSLPIQLDTSLEYRIELSGISNGLDVGLSSGDAFPVVNLDSTAPKITGTLISLTTLRL